MPSDANVTPSPTPEHKRQAHNHSSCEYMGGCQNYGPFWVPIIVRHLLFTYLWLAGNGGMGYNYNYYYYHSSIPYKPKVSLRYPKGNPKIDNHPHETYL